MMEESTQTTKPREETTGTELLDKPKIPQPRHNPFYRWGNESRKGPVTCPYSQGNNPSGWDLNPASLVRA